MKRRIAALAVGFCTLLVLACARAESPPGFTTRLPGGGTNNVWYEYNDSRTALVFVHGILGDSRDTWLFSDNGAPKQYWPELVLRDRSLGRVSVFLGGYYTAVDSNNYDVRDAATELWSALNRKLEFAEKEVPETVLDKKHIVFVTHSTGGIVVRYMLHRHRELFRDKIVGLLLIASPSYGSQTANTLGLIADLYQQKQAKQLRWANELIVDLDKNFKDMVYERRIPELLGVEALENHFIVHRKWLPNKLIVVDEMSGGRYFGAPIRLRNTDHFSAVKPADRNHPAHELLSDFMRRQVNPAIAKAAEARITALQQDVMGVRGVFEKLEDNPVVAAGEVQARAGRLADQLAAVPDELLSLRTQFLKYSYAGYAYTMASRVEGQTARRIELASRGLKACENALELMKVADDQALAGDAAAQEIIQWLEERSANNFIHYQMAFAHAVRLRAGGPSTVEDVKKTVQRIAVRYWKEYPLAKDSDLDLVLKGTL